MRSQNTLSQRRRTFESLEHRNLLAGNIGVAVVGTTLTLTGDNAANVVQVSQTASGAWKVQGIGTRINGGNGAQVFAGVTDIDADLGARNDIIQVFKGTLSGHVSIEPTSNGNKVVQVDRIHAQYINTDLLDGNNVVTYTNCTTDTFIEVDAGKGRNAISIVNCSNPDSNITIDTGDGADVISVVNCTIGDNITIDTGGGNDAVAVVNCTVTERNILVDTGDGKDVVTIANNTAPEGIFDGGGNPGDTLIYKHLNNHFTNIPPTFITGFQYVV